MNRPRLGLILLTFFAAKAFALETTERLDLAALDVVASQMFSGDPRNRLEARRSWNSFLLTSHFEIPFQLKDDERNPLIAIALPGSRPRWETGRNSLVRPFAYEEILQAKVVPAEEKYFREQEAQVFQNESAVKLRGNSELIAWTDAWIAQNLAEAANKKKADEKCSIVSKALSARALLTGGDFYGPRQWDSSKEVLFLYGLSLPEFELHPCLNVPRITWGMMPLKNPFLGVKEVKNEKVERGKGWVNKSVSFDIVAFYDLKLWKSTAGKNEWTLKKGSLVLKDENGKKTSFSKLLQELRKNQEAFEELE